MPKGNPNKYDISIHKRVTQLYCRGKIIPEISRITDIPEYQISSILNLYLKPERRDLKQKYLSDKICYLYTKTNVSAMKLSKYLKIEMGIVYNTLKKENICLRERKLPRPKPNHTNRIYTIDPYYFDEIDTEEKAYWLGFIAADGCVTNPCKKRPSGYLKISLSSRDADHLSKFLKAIKANNKILDSGKNQSTINVNCAHMMDSLRKHGIISGKTYVYVFPSLPEKLRSHFIRGFFDGDGCITYSTTNKRRYPLGAIHLIGTIDVLENIRNEFVNSIGLNKTKIYVPHVEKDNGITRGLTYGGIGNLEKIYDYLYRNTTVCMDRKHQKFLQYFQAAAEYKSRKLLEPPKSSLATA